MKRKFDKIIFAFLMGILLFSMNKVSAKDIICEYSNNNDFGAIILYYNNDYKVTYQYTKYANCGTAEAPCATVKFKDASGKKLDLKKYDFSSDTNATNGNISKSSYTCPPLYYSFSKEKSGSKYKRTVTFTWDQNDGDHVALGFNSTTKTMDSRTDSSATCTSEQKSKYDKKFTELYNEADSKYKGFYDTMVTHINNENSDRYMGTNVIDGKSIGNNQTGDFTTVYEMAMRNLEEYIKGTLQCNMDMTAEAEKLKSQMDAWWNKYVTKATELLEEDIKKYGELDENQLENFKKRAEEATDIMNQTVENRSAIVNLGSKVALNCHGILGDDVLDLLEDIFTWIKIAVPIIVIILGMLDFSKAVLVQEKDDLSKATSKLIKRCIIAVGIFFIPSLLNFILRAFNDVTKANTSTCGIGYIIRYFR